MDNSVTIKVNHRTINVVKGIIKRKNEDRKVIVKKIKESKKK